ncbi:MAG: twin-arginine translocase subunit TatC [Clostridia bacterium]|nr:twin-arginine translocase subunit TatC [Clostridia bacterium]
MTDQEKTARKEALMEHVRALRTMLIWIAGAVLIAFVAVFYVWGQPLMDWVISPIKARGVEVIYTAMSEAMMTQLKVCLMAGIVAASPVIVWQVWRFVSPALYPHEKKAFAALFFVALILFLTGVAFAYFAVYTLAIDFFLVAGENLATPMLSIDKFVSFSFGFILPFGVMFQLPVVIYMLARRGKVTPRVLQKNRKYVVLAIFVIAAFLTPPDVVSQVSLALPMLLLYEVSIWVAKLVKPKQVANV